jgi:hypothetical protein
LIGGEEMKNFGVLIILMVVVARAEGESKFYYAHQPLISEAYEGLICQEGLDKIQKRLQDDDSKKYGERGKLDYSDRKVFEVCRAKLAGGATSDFSTSLNKKLLAVLTKQLNCRCPIPTPLCLDDDLNILSLEAEVAEKWTSQLRTQLRKTGPTEHYLRVDLISALKSALGDHCNYVSKS